MTTALRSIDTAPFLARLGKSLPAPAWKIQPKLLWITISRLRIDPSYQREIGDRGKSTILKIYRAFDWHKFSPVIVAPIGKEPCPYAIIDGQHRTTAAMLRGVAHVPCMIIYADTAEQADIFAAINSVVTSITPGQMHRARLAAGDADAAALKTIAEASGIDICRHAVPANKMKLGQTIAIGALYKALKRYGASTLTAALRCIVSGGDRSIGMVRAQIIEAMCIVLDAEPAWHASPALINVMTEFDFAKAYAAALSTRTTANERISAKMVDAICAHLELKMAP